MHGVSRFRLHRFVTNLLLLSFAISGVSGVVLFFRPEGSLARWLGWSVIGLDKKQWEAVHLVFVVALLLTAVVHVWYNWRPLVAYLRATATSVTRFAVPSRELLAAAAVMLVVFGATLLERPPMSGLVGLRTAMKDGALRTRVLPPTSDADRLTVGELCGRTAMSVPEAIANARAHGIAVSGPSVTLGAVGRENGRSPEAVYRAILHDHGESLLKP
jgi:hypothetical protein